jgi:hypothetical protein
MAIDHPALIQTRHGFASSLCIDHGSFCQGFGGAAACPVFDPVAANKLLDDYSWVKGADGVRTKGNQRLESSGSLAKCCRNVRDSTKSLEGDQPCPVEPLKPYVS